MAVHRRSFALVIVLVATAAVFALALQGGLALRIMMIESGAVRDGARLRRDASDAALAALVGLTTPAGADGGAQIAAGGAERAQPAIDKVTAPEVPELPPEIKQLIGNMLDKPKQPDSPSASSNASSGAAPPRRRDTLAYKTLAKVGLPASPVEVEINGRRFHVTLSDGAGGLNINLADEDQIIRYLQAKGLADSLSVEIAQQIIDWRDLDDFARPHGAERDDYARRAITIRNGPMRTIEELLYLPSMTREVFDLIRPDITIIGDGKAHAGSASREVLMSLAAMSSAAADQLIALRRGGPITKEGLESVLTGLSRQAEGSIRLEPTGLIEIRVEALREGGGTAFVGEAIVNNREGIVVKELRPAGPADQAISRSGG